tara:strand:+ start:137 stop:358 length:222 start_codon:yes stop_codon:yes gene_type:complete
MKNKNGTYSSHIELHGYGTGFSSLEEIITAVRQRQEKGLPLRGAAVMWPNDGERVGVRILSNGDINFSHTEHF